MKSIIIGIDPGPTRSAIAVVERGWLVAAAWRENNHALGYLEGLIMHSDVATAIIEQCKSYGHIVGDPLLQAVRWAGRFEQCILDVTSGCRRSVQWAPFSTVASHHTHHARNKTANVRAAIIAQYDTPRDCATKATGKAACHRCRLGCDLLLIEKQRKKGCAKKDDPRDHIWDAFALALYARDEAARG